MNSYKSTLITNLFTAAGLAFAAAVGAPIAMCFGKSWAEVWPNGLGLLIAAIIWALLHIFGYLSVQKKG